MKRAMELEPTGKKSGSVFGAEHRAWADRGRGTVRLNTIRWEMLGCGEVAETHNGPSQTGAANSPLVAVADRNPGRAESFARRHGVARWHDDAEAIIAAPDIDAVYVATMIEPHRDFVLGCAAAGKPVLTEKPMAVDHAEALDMIAACRRSGECRCGSATTGGRCRESSRSATSCGTARSARCGW